MLGCTSFNRSLASHCFPESLWFGNRMWLFQILGCVLWFTSISPRVMCQQHPQWPGLMLTAKLFHSDLYKLSLSLCIHDLKRTAHPAREATQTPMLEADVTKREASAKSCLLLAAHWPGTPFNWYIDNQNRWEHIHHKTIVTRCDQWPSDFLIGPSVFLICLVRLLLFWLVWLSGLKPDPTLHSASSPIVIFSSIFQPKPSAEVQFTRYISPCLFPLDFRPKPS